MVIHYMGCGSIEGGRDTYTHVICVCFFVCGVCVPVGYKTEEPRSRRSQGG